MLRISQPITSEQYKCQTPFLLIYHSIFITPSCQADYHDHALYRSSARLFMAWISPMCCPYFSYRYLCNFVTFVYIICIPIIFVLNDYIHTFSIHCTWSFSIIKLFIIGQVLSYTNNCKKMEQSNYFFYFFQWWNWQRSEMFRAAVAKGF